MNDSKRVLVTGASKGIGRAVIDRLSADGYDVVGLARTRPAGLSEQQEFHCCDLTDLEATRSLIKELAAKKPFYALVNNAAMAPTTSIDDTSIADMQAAVQLNLNAVLVCTQAVLPGMRAIGGGRIVNLSSRAALGKINRGAYGATKAGVIGMSRTWALELAKDNITVNLVAPGPTATELFNISSRPEDPRTKALLASIPLGRIGRPDEMAHAIAYLIDERAGFMTGQTLYIDGGLTVGQVYL
ncbi:MAG: SDR family oxidoreductase [Janthinobacterium lividum]